MIACYGLRPLTRRLTRPLPQAVLTSLLAGATDFMAPVHALTSSQQSRQTLSPVTRQQNFDGIVDRDDAEYIFVFVNDR